MLGRISLKYKASPNNMDWFRIFYKKAKKKFRRFWTIPQPMHRDLYKVLRPKRRDVRFLIYIYALVREPFAGRQSFVYVCISRKSLNLSKVLSGQFLLGENKWCTNSCLIHTQFNIIKQVEYQGERAQWVDFIKVGCTT
jgi:hypothetical protein